MILKRPLTELGISVPKYVILQTPIHEAVDLMRQFRIGSMLVVDEEVFLKGIITERDILMKFACLNISSDDPIDSLMTPNPLCLRENNVIKEAMDHMLQGNFRHIPIVNNEGHPTGIISIKDILAYIQKNS